MNNKPIEAEASLVTREPGNTALAMRDPESIVRFALEQKADVGTMERILAMRRELRAEQAKELFDAAMAAFQAECPIIIKSKAGAKGAYNYAPLDHIVAQTKALIQKHGFSFHVNSEVDNGWVKAICTIKHNAGHAEETTFKVPIDTRATMMNAPQQYAGAMTFSKRYAFCNAFGILTADEDLDGGNRPKPAGPSSMAPEATAPNLKALARELWDVLKTVRGTAKPPNWIEANNWLWANEILDPANPEDKAPDLSPERFKQCIAKAKEILDAN